MPKKSLMHQRNKSMTENIGTKNSQILRIKKNNELRRKSIDKVKNLSTPLKKEVPIIDLHQTENQNQKPEEENNKELSKENESYLDKLEEFNFEFELE